MKPPRGKRVDPQSRPAEFSSEGAARASGRRSFGTLLAFTTRVGRVHFPQAERHDRFSGRSEGGEEGRWALHGAYCYSLACPDPPGDRGAAVGVGRLRPPGMFDWQRLGNRVCRPLPWMDRGVGPPAQGQWRIGRPSTRPVLKHGPRSLTCARVVG